MYLQVMSTIGKLEVLCTELKSAQTVKGSSLQFQKKQEQEHKYIIRSIPDVSKSVFISNY